MFALGNVNDVSELEPLVLPTVECVRRIHKRERDLLFFAGDIAAGPQDPDAGRIGEWECGARITCFARRWSDWAPIIFCNHLENRKSVDSVSISCGDRNRAGEALSC